MCILNNVCVCGLFNGALKNSSYVELNGRTIVKWTAEDARKETWGDMELICQDKRFSVRNLKQYLPNIKQQYQPTERDVSVNDKVRN